MNQPSSTITAAFLAGMAMSLFWLVYSWLHLGPDATPEIVSVSTTFVSTLVGYLKPERVYANGAPWTEGARTNAAKPPEDTQ